VNVPSKAIQLGNDQGGAVQSAESECFRNGGRSLRLPLSISTTSRTSARH
jgi:hypothetical protein